MPNLTTVIDHIQPWKFYITNNGTVRTFCDRYCHFEGISRTEAVSLCSNDNLDLFGRPNLRGLCTACNGLKAADDRRLYQVTDFSITVRGHCPGEQDCKADVAF